ncbi:MAG TPA: hypothetical protein VMQ93_16640 [Novosphingobium sp.]|nr:hypothetical protein [Novosphingobium sp.]
MAANVIETLPVPENIPAGFDEGVKHICFKISIIGDPTKILFGYKKDEFASEVEAFNFMRKPWVPPMLPDNPLDIVFKDARWLHIGFYLEGNVQFSPTSPGISLKVKSTSGIGGLRHVSSTKTESFAPIPDCRHLFLAVLPPPQQTYNDFFNLHVEVLQTIERGGVLVPASLPLILDPSIKYPG